jgi:hypothetical protein
MQNFKLAVAMSALFLSLPSYGDSLQVREFQTLPADQQRQIVDASYNAITAALAFANTEKTGSRAAKKFTFCLRDRDTDWVVGTVNDYIDHYGEFAKSLGGAITQAMMWKCGVLIFRK